MVTWTSRVYVVVSFFAAADNNMCFWLTTTLPLTSHSLFFTLTSFLAWSFNTEH